MMAGRHQRVRALLSVTHKFRIIDGETETSIVARYVP